MSRSVAVLTKLSRITTNQFDHSWVPSPNPEYRGVILGHGAGGPTMYTVGSGQSAHPPMAELPYTLGEAGFCSVAGQMHDNAWANDLAMGDMNAARTLLGTVGAKNDKVHLLGVSMGALTVIRWAILNPTLVASVTGVLPLTNLVYFYDNNIGGFQTQIAAAWGVTAPNPLPAAADIQAQAGTLLTNGISVKLYYSDPDAFVRPVDVTGFATASGGTATQVGTNGHTVASERDTATLLGGTRSWAGYAASLAGF